MTRDELYTCVFEEYQQRLLKYHDDLFPIIPLNFMQRRQLAMLAATIAVDMISLDAQPAPVDPETQIQETKG